MEKTTIDKEMILGYVDDLISSFAYYDRKEDEDLNVDQLNQAVKKGVVSVDEMTERFQKGLQSIQAWKNEN